MATVILLRHGRTSANASGILAGRTPGVHLDDVGQAQAVRAGERLAVVPLAALVTSPLERCRETARAVATRQAARPRVRADKALTECDYGEWQGRPLRELAKEPLWKTVQTNPSAATFPGGESLPQMQARAVAAVRRRDAAVRGRARPRRGLGGGQPRRRDQVRARRRARHAPRPLPAASRSTRRRSRSSATPRPGPTCSPPTPTTATSPGSPRSRARPRAAPHASRGAAVGGGAGPSTPPRSPA